MNIAWRVMRMSSRRSGIVRVVILVEGDGGTMRVLVVCQSYKSR